MIPLPFSVTLLGVFTLLIYLGLGQRILDRMRLKGSTAIIILVLMIIGHFLPTIPLGSRLALNLGAIIPLGVVIYLLITTSGLERQRAVTVSVLTALLILLTDKLLPPDPGILDPVFSGGIFAGLLAYALGRSRRSAFIAGILGILLTDLVALAQLWIQKVPQEIILGSGGLISSLVISPFLAVIIAEVIGEIRERMHRGVKVPEGGHEDE